MTEKYVAYYRVSTQKQGADGLGMDAQRRDIQIFMSNYCDGCELVAEYSEVASGGKNNRPVLQEAIAACKVHKASLLVSRLDRLSRNTAFVTNLLDDSSDVEIEVASLPKADKMNLRIYAVLAEKEREFISVRTKAALAEAKRRGVKLGGLRDKTGQRNKVKKQIANDRAEALRSLVEPYVAQKMSLRQIANALNQANVATTGNKSTKWSAATVSNLIKRLSVISK